MKKRTAKHQWSQGYEAPRCGFLECDFNEHEHAYWVQWHEHFTWTAGYGREEIGRFDHPSDAIAAVEKAIAERSRALKREKRK